MSARNELNTTARQNAQQQRQILLMPSKAECNIASEITMNGRWGRGLGRRTMNEQSMSTPPQWKPLNITLERRFISDYGDAACSISSLPCKARGSVLKPGSSTHLPCPASDSQPETVLMLAWLRLVIVRRSLNSRGGCKAQSGERGPG